MMEKSIKELYQGVGILLTDHYFQREKVDKLKSSRMHFFCKHSHDNNCFFHYRSQDCELEECCDDCKESIRLTKEMMKESGKARVLRWKATQLIKLIAIEREKGGSE